MHITYKIPEILRMNCIFILENYSINEKLKEKFEGKVK